ncbi:MAG TPA: hypothetical protein PLS70_13780, partial [Acidobacteriota bacterium]|nr:hypothetical protein [Acidobacteriota bacterium]
MASRFYFGHLHYRRVLCPGNPTRFASRLFFSHQGTLPRLSVCAQSNKRQEFRFQAAVQVFSLTVYAILHS